jgi:hypothetical protein
MKEPKLSHIVDPLRELLYQYDVIIKGFRERTKARIAGVSCGMFPDEIAACAGLIPLRLPSFFADCCACGEACPRELPDGIYDILVFPRGCKKKYRDPARGVPLREFDCPPGWGAESSIKMGSSLDAFLQEAGCPALSDLDKTELRAATREYNAMRRAVRGIALVRRDKPDLISCEDLASIFDAAAVLPPSIIIGHLAAILDILNRSESGYVGGKTFSLGYASFIKDPRLLDRIEDAGCLIVEDDFCNGRRQFDMSYNDESADLLSEILDSYSYRPRCPTVRPAEERFELLYKMAKSNGIELVIFIQDSCCPAKLRDIDALRIRLMRAGIDPLVVTSADAFDKIRNYSGRV